MPLGLHQTFAAQNLPQSQGPVPQPAYQDRRPMGGSFQSQGPVPQHVYRQQYDEPQNARTGPRDNGGVAPGNGSPFIFQGDATGGEVPPMFARYSAPPSIYPGSSPDGTDGGYTGYAAPMFLDRMMSRMAEAAAARQQKMAQLQGLFGGGDAGDTFNQPVNIQYPGFTQNMQAFDDLSRWLMQRNMPGYLGDPGSYTRSRHPSDRGIQSRNYDY